ncbi:MAG: GNAT family N-acetyltransferase [Devosia sp.]|uniref:GNAT family N-acetyltransferase n=1 Tax=unclassified Devosia TaxID=196773 RepID=UPI0019D867D7|nr:MULTISPECIES: GNAT family N-acetyltransferase [unclassified Devosia]MBF0678339.1 GNAT family N-acetyltransferase [Devosia sp.]WEJ31590.1 GNAT family N-acetyltransferase [Devosia sp. SD17-2]
MPRTAIRKAELADAPRMATLAYEAWETGILPLLTEAPMMRESERRRLSQAAALGWQHAIIASHEQELVGWCSRIPRRNYIPFLFVAPECQGQGVGRELLSRMEVMLELEGAERVHLETPADNVRAVRFYERQGYRIMALRGSDGDVRQSFMSVHLEKRLNPLSGDQYGE